MKSLPFQLAVLKRMSPSYQEILLDAVGLKASDFESLAGESELEFPDDLSSDLETYRRILGAEFQTNIVTDEEDALFGSTGFCFLLPLWPHLFWVVYRHPSGYSWNVGFEPQVKTSLGEFCPSLVRPGIWTFDTLQKIATKTRLFDGWDERVTWRFDFEGAYYEGTFTFYLLDEWRKIRQDEWEENL